MKDLKLRGRELRLAETHEWWTTELKTDVIFADNFGDNKVITDV